MDIPLKPLFFAKKNPVHWDEPDKRVCAYNLILRLAVVYKIVM